MQSHRLITRPYLVTTFERACASLETILAGDVRRGIVDEAAAEPDLARALMRLRDGMRANVWKTGGDTFSLDRMVRKYDRQTRQDGFHALHDWDGIADQVNADIIPVDVLHYTIDQRGGDPPDRTSLAILLDYYFVHLLSLVSLRVWDAGSADANLDQVTRLLALLQGAEGSGQPFAHRAETLLLLATSHYERKESGYASLLDRTRALDDAHRLIIALGHAASMGCHLRFGFEATYGRDTVNMRDDNVADYPWLCFALVTLMREYARLHAADEHGPHRDHVVEALLAGLSADARAFVGVPPRSLSASGRERTEFVDRFREHQHDLVAEFERFRPSDDTYSPLAFFFNFSHNVLKGTVVDALLGGQPWALSFDDLLVGAPRGAGHPRTNELKLRLARTLMAYARTNPHKIRGKMMPVIVYDPIAGRQAYSVTLRKLKE